MKSKYVDTTAIVQVIGNVFNSPKILDYGDKYSITENDFVEDFHKIVFGSIYKLYELGAKEITIENICDFLSSRPKSEAIFKKEKGEEWLLKASEQSVSTSFDYYYNRMKKMSLLRAYDNYGIDVSFIYDPEEVLDFKKKQRQEEQLDGSSLESIALKIENVIEKIRYEYVGGEGFEEYQAGDGIENLLEELKKHPEVGIPMYGSLINTVTRGARLGKFYLRSAPTGVGKAIPNDTLIPTPQGFKKVKDVQVGDMLFDREGLPTKVLKVFPQKEDQNIWKITFVDGRQVECCENHLWKYRYRTHRGFAYRTETTKEIYERSLKLKNGFKNPEGRGYRFQIPLNEAVQYPSQQLDIDPYTFGAVLGDGSFRWTGVNKALTFSSADEEIPNYIAKSLGEGWYPQKNSHYNYNYTFKNINNPEHNLWVSEFLGEKYSELDMCKSEDKFIPKDYLIGDVSQRLALLQGLMDTDGSIDDKGRTKFTTVSKRLRDDFVSLCRSLGFVTSVSIDEREDKYTTGECYSIHIQTKKEMKPLMFKLKRKKEKAEKYATSNKRSEHKETLGIVSIEPTEKKVPMTCFMVDNEEHLFLMNDYIVTHNSRTMIADICNFACDMIYYDDFGWVWNGTSEPCLYITTEQDLGEVQTMMLAFLSNVEEDHILNGWYQEGEEARVLKAAEILKRSPLRIEVMHDFSLQDVENRIKRAVREYNVRYVGFDYIHTSLKILEEISRRSGGVKIREDNVLFMLSARLKDICNQYGIFILSSTQLNGDYAISDTPDQNLLRGAKSIADRIDLGMILLPAKQQDIESLTSVLGENGFEKPNLKLSIYKNRRGKYKGVYLWCRGNLGTCRVEPLFMTGYDYELIYIDDFKIEVGEKHAF